MKLRLVAALALISFLLGAVAHAAVAGPPPASWELDNPARCPYPFRGEPPACFLPTPAPSPLPSPEVKS